jgi:hypothetical protein
VTDDDLVPVSVRLGQVVPPEDPEDWTRPLTWVAALGMLAGPIAVLAWFLLAPPTGSSGDAGPFGPLAAAILAGGAAVVGATQVGATRASTATLGAALFGALVAVAIGVGFAGERQIDAASSTVEHAFATAIGGVGGAAAAALASIPLARLPSRLARSLPAAGIGAAVAATTVSALFT